MRVWEDYLLARLMFAYLDFAARKGLAPAEADSEAADSTKQRARQVGVRGETYAYWYLRRKGYVMVARNYTFPGMKGEIDMVGYDGAVLAFVEVKTRSGSQIGKYCPGSRGCGQLGEAPKCGANGAAVCCLASRRAKFVPFRRLGDRDRPGLTANCQVAQRAFPIR